LLDGLKTSACGKLPTGITEITESPKTWFTPGEDIVIINAINRHRHTESDDSMLSWLIGIYIKLLVWHKSITGNAQIRNELKYDCCILRSITRSVILNVSRQFTNILTGQ
jgi:hypothetical protein